MRSWCKGLRKSGVSLWTFLSICECQVLACQRKTTIKGSVNDFEILGPLIISAEWLELRTWNLICGWSTWRTSLWTTTYPKAMLGHGQGMILATSSNLHAGPWPTFLVNLIQNRQLDGRFVLWIKLQRPMKNPHNREPRQEDPYKNLIQICVNNNKSVVVAYDCIYCAT